MNLLTKELLLKTKSFLKVKQNVQQIFQYYKQGILLENKTQRFTETKIIVQRESKITQLQCN